MTLVENKRIISPTEIDWVIRGERFYPPPETAQRGREMHQKIIGMAIRGEMTLPGMRQNLAPINFRGEVNRVVEWPELDLRAKIDLWAEKERLVVEIKPGVSGQSGKKQLRGGWLLQTAYNCMAAKARWGVIYLYNSQNSFTLDDGGRPWWKKMEKIADDASRIREIRKVLDRQDQLETKKKKQGELPMAQRSMSLRGEMAMEVWNVAGVKINLPEIKERVGMGIGLEKAEIQKLKLFSIGIRKRLDPLVMEVTRGLISMTR